jgi:hypothetical protein
MLPHLGKCQRSGFIHAPIDSILLNKLSAEMKNKRITATPWTTLNDADYAALVMEIKIIPRYLTGQVKDMIQNLCAIQLADDPKNNR